jgi:hypothetical protein
MPITEENRREFEQLGTDQLSKRVERKARDWLNENNPSWISAREAQRAGIKATIALVISGLALLVSIAGLWKSY